MAPTTRAQAALPHALPARVKKQALTRRHRYQRPEEQPRLVQSQRSETPEKEGIPFKTLPLEVRRLIWKASIPDFAPCEFRMSKCMTTHKLLVRAEKQAQDRIATLRSLLLACREARDEVTLHFPIVLPFEGGAMRFNPMEDVVMFRTRPFGPMKDIPLEEREFPRGWVDVVHNIAITTNLLDWAKQVADQKTDPASDPIDLRFLHKQISWGYKSLEFLVTLRNLKQVFVVPTSTLFAKEMLSVRANPQRQEQILEILGTFRVWVDKKCGLRYPWGERRDTKTAEQIILQLERATKCRVGLEYLVDQLREGVLITNQQGQTQRLIKNLEFGVMVQVDGGFSGSISAWTGDS